MYIGFKTFFCVVRHLDFIASYLHTGLHLGFFRSWPSLYLPSSFSNPLKITPCSDTLVPANRDEGCFNGQCFLWRITNTVHC